MKQLFLTANISIASPVWSIDESGSFEVPLQAEEKTTIEVSSKTSFGAVKYDNHVETTV